MKKEVAYALLGKRITFYTVLELKSTSFSCHGVENDDNDDASLVSFAFVGVCLKYYAPVIEETVGCDGKSTILVIIEHVRKNLRRKKTSNTSIQASCCPSP